MAHPSTPSTETRHGTFAPAVNTRRRPETDSARKLTPVLLARTAGWCGLTTTALNLLPVGTLDGGRLMLSAYGQRTLNITSLFTYAGLGLGLLGSSLSLPFGLYVLICQRNPEQYVQDTVTPPPQPRQSVTAAMAVFAVLILLPMSPFASDVSSGVSGGMMM